MNIRSLVYKNQVTDPATQESYLDLTFPSFRYRKANVLAAFRVTPLEEGRVDLISIKFYGSPSYVDAILSYNRIFNPFSIKDGDLLIIPDVSNEREVYDIPSAQETNTSPLSTFTDTARLSTQDANRIERLKKIAQKKANGNKNPAPPNILQPGKEAKSAVDGAIILGNNLNSREGMV